MSLKFKLHPKSAEIPEPEKPWESQSTSGLLLRLFHELAKANSLNKYYSLTSNYSLKIFHASTVSIYLPAKDKKFLVDVDSSFASEVLREKLNKISLFNKVDLHSKRLIARAFKTGETEFISEQLPNQFRRAGLKSSLILPMIVKEKILGVLVIRSEELHHYSNDDIRNGQLLALHLALKIDNFNLNQSIREQKERLELVQNSIREGLSLHGEDGVIYYANKIVGQFFGTTMSTIGLNREELVRNWKKYHKWGVERLYDAEEMKKKVYKEHQAFEKGLMKVLSKPPRWVSASYYPILKKGEFGGMVAVYRDVTREKEQEEQLTNNFSDLQTERDRWKTIFQNVDEGVCIVDRNLKIIDMNPACEELIGGTLGEVRGSLCYDAFKCHTKEGLYSPDFAPLEKLLITKEPIPYEEFLITNSKGEELWVGVSASQIIDPEGNIDEIVLVLRDVSSFKEIDRAKSEFVSVASHELRTPLTVINGYLSLLLNGDLGDFRDESSLSQMRTVLKKIAGETARLTNLVSELLNVSRIEENRVHIDLRAVDVRELLQEVLDEFRNIALEKDLKLSILDQTDKNEAIVRADRDKLFQSIFNLVDNAVKFTPSSGEVLVSFWEEASSVKIRVRDTGVGIPRRMLPIIFEKFQQIPGSYLKENRGTGLGLFIVKSLIELQQGSLEVDSILGKGTTFTINLPTFVA